MNYPMRSDSETEVEGGGVAATSTAGSHDGENLTQRRPPRGTRSKPRPKVGLAGNRRRPRPRPPNQLVRPLILQLEVCHGPDCFGSGGGAAMIEIEELVQEYQQQQQRDAEKNYEEGDDALDEEVGREGREESSREDVLVVKVVKGGCRNFCSMGPNVHVSSSTCRRNRSRSRSSSSSSTTEAMSKSLPPSASSRHFTKVSNVKECQLVVQSIIADYDCYGHDDGDNNNGYDGENSTTTNIARRMMIQKSERKRWEFLREMARSTKMKDKSKKKTHQQQQNEYQTRQRQTQVVSPTNNSNDDVHCSEDHRRHHLELLLEEVITVEMDAVKNDPDLIGRCQRRKDRIRTMLVKLDEEEEVEKDGSRNSNSDSEDALSSSSSSSSSISSSLS